MNNLKTVVLMAAISGLLIAVGGAIGGLGGAIAFAVIAGAMNFASYWFSADIVLRSSGAHEIQREQDPHLFDMIGEVAQRANMPMPRVYIIDSAQPNAFATGRNPKHAAVAVTAGIRQLLTDRELVGVLGHEISHVKNRDILTSSIVATIASAISMISWMAMWFGGGNRENRNPWTGLVVMLVAPVAATLIQLGISRAREYQADADGARTVGDPEALASALAKLQMGAQRIPMDVPASTAHLYIVNPLRGGGVAGLFSTHPPLEKRIERLRSMSV
ncbi:MAG: zinc metalloprotease HtpX [Dehalococcoidia bacterium]|nr:zinc metalloprotease HtpX [Dehalococcoidia bacterium]HRC63234.1 zinc metalloprotease HtpX [Dehalococcoidia bacterium]